MGLRSFLWFLAVQGPFRAYKALIFFYFAAMCWSPDVAEAGQLPIREVTSLFFPIEQCGKALTMKRSHTYEQVEGHCAG
jgi:hypothetical protein